MSSVAFDPYHKWLGIPHSEQPAHHYRLLGIPTFEDDPQVIEGACDRQMAFLRKFQAGEHASDAMKLLNEISRVRLCLLKPNTKAEYDASLKLQLAVAVSTDLKRNVQPFWKHPLVLGSVGIAVTLIIAVGLQFRASHRAAQIKPLPATTI